ncbi:ubiquitin, partial [Ephemerocybe angulata]
GKRITIPCKFSETIDLIQGKVQDTEGVPPDRQRLVYAGLVLQDEYALGQH